jgi:single-strand DNA-binding protein
MNVVAITGRLSSEPTVRELPTGSVLINFEATTKVGNVSVSVPLVWFDPAKMKVPVKAGDEIAAFGTIRRRFYQAGGSTQSRTEMVVVHLGRQDDRRTMAAQRKWLAAAKGAEVFDGLRSC